MGLNFASASGLNFTNCEDLGQKKLSAKDNRPNRYFFLTDVADMGFSGLINGWNEKGKISSLTEILTACMFRSPKTCMAKSCGDFSINGRIIRN